MRDGAKQSTLPKIEAIMQNRPSRIGDAPRLLSDTLAAGVLFECQRRGIRVPEDLAIMGFGASIWDSRSSNAAARDRISLIALIAPIYFEPRIALSIELNAYPCGGLDQLPAAGLRD